MKAMLLAAGLGTRLRPFTDEVPKCMVPVGGIPVLVRNLAWLREYGVTDVVINLHHRPTVVTGAIGDGSQLGMRVAYSHEPSLLGTGGALGAARALLGDQAFVTLYADNLIDCRLDRVLVTHRSSKATMTVALFERPDVSSSGVAELDASGRVLRFIEKPAAGMTTSRWVNAGLLVCEEAVFDAIPASVPSDLGRDVLPALIGAQHHVQGYLMQADERVHWIDTPADLELTERFMTARSAG